MRGVIIREVFFGFGSTMLTKAILICGLATFLTDAAVIKGENCSVLFPADQIVVSSGWFSRGAGQQQCSVGEGEWKANINDGYITEASGLAYSRRSDEVNIYSPQ